jgi:hypothetical protein
MQQKNSRISGLFSRLRSVDFRTIAERVRFVRVRGAIKVKCHLMFGSASSFSP